MYVNKLSKFSAWRQIEGPYQGHLVYINKLSKLVYVNKLSKFSVCKQIDQATYPNWIYRIKLQVSFAKVPYKRDDILQKIRYSPWICSGLYPGTF